MRNWNRIISERLQSLQVDPARAADIVDELAQHAAQHYADLRASGVADKEAAARALTLVDDGARVATEIARADRPRPSAVPPPAPAAHWWTTIPRDVRYAFRLLRRAPGFALLAILTLALGVGANTAIFSVVNAVLLQPLPYADADRLVMVGERAPEGSASTVGYATFVDWRDRSRGFEDLAVIRLWTPTLLVNAEPERVSGMRVSANYFQMLGVRPALGRDFRAEEDTPAGSLVAMLSDGLWRRRFDADPSIVGRIITMNDLQYTVVGVLPRTFEPLISEHFYQRAEIWAPVGYDASLPFACRSCRHLMAIGRLKAGVSIDAAREDIDSVQAALKREYPTNYAKSTTMTLVPLREELTGRMRAVLMTLMGAVAFVLVIACANVANLLLARTARRARELALRMALGASRAQILRQLLIESLVIALAGGIAGILVSIVGVPLIVRLSPVTIARLADARIDGHVLAFTLIMSFATALLFGLAPAIAASKSRGRIASDADGRRTSNRSTSIMRRLLVTADVSLAVALLIGAGLMIRSVDRLLGVNPGFDPSHVLTMQVSLVGSAYANSDVVLSTVDRMLQRLRAMPGVDAAASASEIPFGGSGDRRGFHIQSMPKDNPANDPWVERYGVTPEYFKVMRIPLIRGRLITDADQTNSEPVVVIGETTARTLFAGRDPIGEHVRVGDPTQGPWLRVVGIAGDVRHTQLGALPAVQMYTPESQITDSFLTIVMRVDGEMTTVTGEARRAIGSVAHDVPVYNVAPLADLVERSAGSRRFVMVLLGLFSASALLLATIGVYGVIACSVAERTREIGIRSALGASRRSIVQLVARTGLVTIAAGLVAGVMLALLTARYLQSSLFEVSPADPLTLTVVAAVLAAVAIAAHAVPVARALGVEPTIALRQE